MSTLESDLRPIDPFLRKQYISFQDAQTPANASDSIKHRSSEPICTIHERGAISPATSAMSPAARNPNMNCDPHVLARPRSPNASVTGTEITDND